MNYKVVVIVMRDMSRYFCDIKIKSIYDYVILNCYNIIVGVGGKVLRNGEYTCFCLSIFDNY